MFGTPMWRSTARAVQAPLARPACMCRGPFPSPSLLASPSAVPAMHRLFSSASPLRSPLLASTSPATLLHRATPPASLPVAPSRGFKMPKSMRRKASPVARNGGAGKTARKHSARAAKRRRQRAKKIN